MNCLEFQEKIQRRFDGEVPNDEPAGEEHLSACPACRELWAAVLRLDSGLRLVPAPVIPEGLAERIVNQVLDERRADVRIRRRLFAGAALAASLFVAVFAGQFLLRTGGKQLPNQFAAQPVEPTQENKTRPVPALAARPSLNKSVEEAGSALVALASRTAEEAISPGKLLLPDAIEAPPMAGVDAWPQSLEPPAESLRSAGQSVSSGLEPVTVPARRAVNLFLRDLPPMDQGPQPQ